VSLEVVHAVYSCLAISIELTIMGHQQIGKTLLHNSKYCAKLNLSKYVKGLARSRNNFGRLVRCSPYLSHQSQHWYWECWNDGINMSRT